MRLYIIRHSDPDYTNNTITEAGHLEAQALAKRLASSGLDRIYCSPLGRALDTMKYTSSLLGLDYIIENWTRELYPELWYKNSSLESIPFFELAGQIYRSGPDMPTHDTWCDLDIFKNSEVIKTVEALRKNSDEFLCRLGYERSAGLYKCNKTNNEQIAIFCHAGLALTWLSSLLEIPVSLMWSGFWLPPSSVTTILFEQHSNKWAVPRCIGLGDISHLYAAGLPVSRTGLKANII